MVKLCLTRPNNVKPAKPVSSGQALTESQYVFNVPGTGRMRTSCNHANFHAVPIKNLIKSRQKIVTNKPCELVGVNYE